MSSLVKLVLEKKIFKFRQCIFTILSLRGLHLNKIESPLPKNAMCQLWLKVVAWFGSFSLNFGNVFQLFRYYLRLEKRVCSFFLTNFKGEDFIYMYFCYYDVISPWKRSEILALL